MLERAGVGPQGKEETSLSGLPGRGLSEPRTEGSGMDWREGSQGRAGGRVYVKEAGTLRRVRSSDNAGSARAATSPGRPSGTHEKAVGYGL